MKRFFGVGLALALTQTVFATELLVNGNLQDPWSAGESLVATGWALQNAGAPPSEPWGTAVYMGYGWADHTYGDDTGRGLFFRPFFGQAGWTDPPMLPPVDASITQEVPGTAGTNYTFSAWWRYETFYSGVDPFAPTTTPMTIEFLDGSSSVIGAAVLDVDLVNPADGAWHQQSLSAVAPAGTASVRVTAAMNDGIFEPSNPQSAFVDDLSLVPEPGTLACMLPALLAFFARRR
ncbi:MAG: hypothetical protein HZB38_01360 [Planctomycetes bacterium]|nr:hypothetical protein [Planctomycetota bacterium]